jgi:hypothetical protein
MNDSSSFPLPSFQQVLDPCVLLNKVCSSFLRVHKLILFLHSLFFFSFFSLLISIENLDGGFSVEDFTTFQPAPASTTASIEAMRHDIIFQLMQRVLVSKHGHNSE